MESVNSATKMQAPAESMVQLGNCVTRLIKMLADNYDLETPFKFAKLDIKDGYWRMRVSSKDAWNFCYVLPQTDPNTTLDVYQREGLIPWFLICAMVLSNGQ